MPLALAQHRSLQSHVGVRPWPRPVWAFIALPCHACGQRLHALSWAPLTFLQCALRNLPECLPNFSATTKLLQTPHRAGSRGVLPSLLYYSCAGDAPVEPSAPLASMSTLLINHAIREVLHYHFVEFTPSVFANVAADATSLERFLASLVENVGPDQFVVEARVRMLWKECASHQGSVASAPSADAASQASKPDSWADPYPAKLSSSMMRELRESVLASYPSELLNPESMPSARLMALVHKGVSEKNLKFRFGNTGCLRLKNKPTRSPDHPKCRGSRVCSSMIFLPRRCLPYSIMGMYRYSASARDSPGLVQSGSSLSLEALRASIFLSCAFLSWNRASGGHRLQKLSRRMRKPGRLSMSFTLIMIGSWGML